MKRWLIGGGVAAGLIAVWLLGPLLLRRIDLFRVRRLELTGAVYLTAGDVAQALALRPGANIFDPLERFRDRVLAMPGVRQVRVGRRIPGALVIEVTEFEPVALTRTDGRLALVDRRGRILPFDPTRAPTDLPIAPADGMVTGVIDELRDADPGLFGAVVSAVRDRSTVIVQTATQRFLFRAGAGPKEVQSLAAVWSEMKRLGLNAGELDARFDGRVVARGRRT
jgi:hypothetical protein